MTNIGLMIGFYGGIVVLGWFYQIIFMPKTKNKSLEEIDKPFSKPTSVIICEDVKDIVEVMRDLKVSYPA
jgi:hypothetical protein